MSFSLSLSCLVNNEVLINEMLPHKGNCGGKMMYISYYIQMMNPMYKDDIISLYFVFLCNGDVLLLLVAHYSSLALSSLTFDNTAILGINFIVCNEFERLHGHIP